MKYVDIGKIGFKGPEIILGCMRIDKVPYKEAEKAVTVSLEKGINFFDHADIYGKGASEEIFGKILKNGNISREEIIIQTKCGIRSGFFDFSKEHIIESLNQSLKRLNVEYVDTLLLHRPDVLVEPEEVSEAFNILYKEGKVKYFGVSNHTPGQIELLQKYVDQRLIVNQLQFSIMHTGMIDHGINMNMKNDSSINRDSGILEYSRLKDMTVQAWSPFQYGFFEGVFIGNDKFPELNSTINKLSKKYDVTPNAVAVAWILRHPAKMQVVIGTMNKDRISDISKASSITLSREEWYEIYRAAGNTLP